MNWNLITDALPAEKQEVLLRWPVPGVPSVFRIGRIRHTPWDDRPPIWIFNLDCGDACATIYSQPDDEQPTHWAVMDDPEGT